MKQKLDIRNRWMAWLGYTIYTAFLLFIASVTYPNGVANAVTSVILVSSIIIGISISFDYHAHKKTSN